jgi:hypothetical protein
VDKEKFWFGVRWIRDNNMPACPLCDDVNNVAVFKKNEFAYYRCKGCQSLFAGLKIGDGAVHEHYGESYYESESLVEKGRRGYPSYRSSYTTLTDGFNKKLALVRKYVSGGRLLDAGAAYGFFLKTAEPYFEGEGIDVSEFAAMIAQREFNAQVKVGDIESVDAPDARIGSIAGKHRAAPRSKDCRTER